MRVIACIYLRACTLYAPDDVVGTCAAGRIAILNQHVSDGFGKLAKHPSMRTVILGATLEDLPAPPQTAAVAAAADGDPPHHRVLRLEFTDHLAGDRPTTLSL